MKYYKLDENNCPQLTDMAGYYEWKNTLPKKIQTEMGFEVDKTKRGDICVSTVFIGMNNEREQLQPALWETMVFGGEHGLLRCNTYTSQLAAEEGHKAACEKYLPLSTESSL